LERHEPKLNFQVEDIWAVTPYGGGSMVLQNVGTPATSPHGVITQKTSTWIFITAENIKSEN